MKMKNDINQKLGEIWHQEKKRFNHPAINESELVSSLEGQNSASFDWADHKVRVSEDFVSVLSENMSEERALQGILRHEIGHWVYFPRELSDRLYLLAEADSWFGPKTEAIYTWYADLADEGSLLATGLAGDELIEMRNTMAAHVKQDKASATMHKLLVSLYANAFEDFKDNMPELSKDELEYYEKLKNVPFVGLKLEEHLASLYRFGKAIESLIPDQPKLYCGVASLDGIPVGELDGALSGVLGKLGIRAFNITKAYLRKIRPDFKDPHEEEKPKQLKQAGLERSDFKRNDDLIPLYSRWAAGHGVYIVKRPVETDTTAHYRSGKKEYEIGDPIHKIDIFGSRGMIGIPGVSKVYEEEEGTVPALQWSVPYANIGIDSSGSMDHPASKQGAPQVLAAFILGKNYHTNGSYVGGWNFSTDIAFLAPQRDIHAFYSLMLGYWGGGTYINIKKLKEFIENSEFGSRMIRFTDEKDYKRALELLPKEERKQFREKNLSIDVSKLKAKVAKLDNFLITDGYIANPEETLEYLQDMGGITRNFVFLTDKESYKNWSSIKIPNTWIYLAEKPKDLLGLALGRSKALVTEARSNYRGVGEWAY